MSGSLTLTHLTSVSLGEERLMYKPTDGKLPPPQVSGPGLMQLSKLGQCGMNKTVQPRNGSRLGVYPRGSKDSMQGNGNKPVMDSLILEKDTLK